VSFPGFGPVRNFGYLYAQNAHVRQQLGKPTDPEVTVRMAEQVFQNGIMLLRSDKRQIYVFLYNGKAQVYADTWREGDPIATGLRPPQGGLEPQRNFGKLWREQPAVHEQLGWAIAEQRTFMGIAQNFEHGVMLWSYQRIIYVFYYNGTWERYLDNFTG
jgi:hypothetical protein